MFCIKCGCQLNDGAAFCHNCGAQVGSTAPNNRAISQDSTSTELNRDALKIYLYDILTLECIKSKYNTNLYNANWWISNTTGNFYEKRYDIVGEESWRGGHNYLYFLYMDNTYYLWVKQDGLKRTYALIDQYNLLPGRHVPPLENCYIYDIEKNYNDMMSLSRWDCWELTFASGYFEKRKKAKKARDAFLRCYEDFKKVAAAGLQDNINTISSWNNYKAGVEKELANVNNLLAKAYSLNIIPSQFRNSIYTIYYLYDFVSTSNQSFTTALMHYDLHEIKMKLDTIIQQQQEIIIQQARMIAQNREIIAQNQACLQKLSSLEKTASSIEYNTAQTAVYSEIASRNAEVCAWISTAQYLDN